jgi:predicted ABC-type ATPase
MKTQPQLIFVAGPNGAGKSTFSKDLSPAGAFIFDPDKEQAAIVLKYPNYPPESIGHAFQQYFQDCIAIAIKKKRDFVIETNFRDHLLMDIAERFKSHGYETNMIYLILQSIPESMARVAVRVKTGGHYIDDASILYNYNEGLKSLEYFAGRFDNLEIIDATGNYYSLRSLLSVQKQQLIYLSNKLPKNAEEIINRIAGRFGDVSKSREDDEERGWDYTRRR